MKKTTKRRPAPEQDRLIVQALRAVGKPVSAYELINELRDEAVLAPQTVYRALDRLIADGRAHRLESINAFIACNHAGPGGHMGTALFAICEQCGAVTEFDEPDVIHRLAAWSKRENFHPRRMSLELRGLCGRCAHSG